MSFQDVGSTPSRMRSSFPRSHSSSSSENALPNTAEMNLDCEGGDIMILKSPSGTNSLNLRVLSDDVLKYQKDVGSLPSALHSATAIIGSSEEWKLKLRFDNARKLGERISLYLSTCEENLRYVPKHRAADTRAAIIKLTRDFRRVEVIFKNLEMDLKRKCADRSKRVDSYESHNIGPSSDQKRNDNNTRELQLQMEEKDRLNEEIMRQREAEVIEINRKMHQVNAIYKDLGELVSSQQELIDQVEVDMEAAAINTKSGLSQLQTANKKSDRVFSNPFRTSQTNNNDEAGESNNTPVSPHDGSCHWTTPFESLKTGITQISEEMNVLQRKMTVMLTFSSYTTCCTKSG